MRDEFTRFMFAEERELFRRICLSALLGACETDLERGLAVETAGSIGSLKSAKLGIDLDLLELLKSEVDFLCSAFLFLSASRRSFSLITTLRQWITSLKY